jgi:hypothetical protein
MIWLCIARVCWIVNVSGKAGAEPVPPALAMNRPSGP